MTKFERFLFTRIDMPFVRLFRAIGRGVSWYTRWIRLSILNVDEFDIRPSEDIDLSTFHGEDDEYLSRLGMDVDRINRECKRLHG